MPKKKLDYAPLPATRSGGGPVLLVPAKAAKAWRGYPDDYDRACEPRDPVETDRGGVGWVEIGDAVGLALGGELETVWVPTSTGGVVVRGPDVSGRSPDDVVALYEQVDAWTDYRDLDLSGDVWLFDSAAPGAAKLDAIDADDGAIAGKLAKGTYHVELASVGANDLVRLRRHSTAKRPPATKLKLPEIELPPPRTRAWQLGEALLQKDLPKDSGPGTTLRSACRAGDRVVGLEGANSRERVVTVVDADGSPRTLGEPGMFRAPSVRPDDSAFIVARGDGTLFEAAVDGTELHAVFTRGETMWSSCALDARTALVDVGDTTLLLARPDGSPVGTPFEVADRLDGFTMPMLTRLADPRFVYVRDEDHAVLITVRGDRVTPVEEFRDVTRRGLSIRQGRPFLYKPRDHKLYELLDLDAAWAEL